MSSYLPQQEGILPQWLVFIGAVSIFNTIQSYTTLDLTRRVYAYAPASEVTTLSSRTFGTWTLLAGVVRFYGAYRLTDPDMYKLVLATYMIALGHFGSEALVFKTTGLRTGAAPTFFIALGTTVWMLVQWGGYVSNGGL